MAALRGASMAAALALPCTLEASDFDDFRIPDHRARSMAMSLSTAATQSWGNSGAFEGESGSWGSGLTANGNWFRDSERIQTSTSFGGLLPADVDGTAAPPSGAPNVQLALGTSSTQLVFWKFHVDFATPANTTFTGPNFTGVGHLLLQRQRLAVHLVNQ